MPINLKRKFIANIIADYLKKNGYEYSYSILMPEAGLDKYDILTINEMCKINEIEDFQYR